MIMILYCFDLTALKYKQFCYFTHNFSSPAGKKLLMFIDDMNMPQVDLYATQQPIALLKLLLEKEACMTGERTSTGSSSKILSLWQPWERWEQNTT